MATTIETMPLVKTADNRVEITIKEKKEVERTEKLGIADLKGRIRMLNRSIQEVEQAKARAIIKYDDEIADKQLRKTK